MPPDDSRGRPDRVALSRPRGPVCPPRADRSCVRVRVRLEAFGARDVAEDITFDEKHGTVTFALAVATTLPGEDGELFVAATLQAFSLPFVGGPETGLAVMHNAKLVDLAVDSVSVQQV